MSYLELATEENTMKLNLLLTEALLHAQIQPNVRWNGLTTTSLCNQDKVCVAMCYMVAITEQIIAFSS